MVAERGNKFNPSVHIAFSDHLPWEGGKSSLMFEILFLFLHPVHSAAQT